MLVALLGGRGVGEGDVAVNIEVYQEEDVVVYVGKVEVVSEAVEEVVLELGVVQCDFQYLYGQRQDDVQVCYGYVKDVEVQQFRLVRVALVDIYYQDVFYQFNYEDGQVEDKEDYSFGVFVKFYFVFGQSVVEEVEQFVLIVDFFKVVGGRGGEVFRGVWFYVGYD